MELKLALNRWLIAGYLIQFIHAQSCTQKVLIEEGNGGSKKVELVRRVPAKCSNWDKAWVWITGMDCGTKYVLQTMNYPSNTQVYRTQKVCCPHETDCKNPATEASKSGGLDENDEKFLAITFGSATAALVIILLIIIISFCRKQQPRFIENFFNRRQRMYEEDIIGVEPSAPYLHTQNDYKNGSLRLIESEYEEIPEYHSKDKYPIVDSVSESNDYVREFTPSERQRSHNPTDYPQVALISLASGSNGGNKIERIAGPFDGNTSSDSYENGILKMLQPVQESCARVNENLSQNANDDLKQANAVYFCENDSPIRNNMSNNAIYDVHDCVRNNSIHSQSSSKCSENSIPNDYIDFSNIVVPNCEQNATATARANSYEKLDMSAREKDSLDQTYDALQLSVNENNISYKS